MDAVALKVALHLGQVALKSEACHHAAALGLVHREYLSAVLFAESGGKLLYIVAVVAVLRELDGVLAEEELEAACLDADGKLLYLIACVVDVKLTGNVVARLFQHGRQCVAEDAASGVAHVHGTRGVCGDEFDHELFALADVAASVIGPLTEDGLYNVRVPAFAETEVHKAGSRYLDGVKPGAGKVKVCEQYLCDLAGRHTHRLRTGEGVVCGVVAVCGVLGDLNAAGKCNALRQFALFGSGGVCLADKLRDLLLCALYHVHRLYLKSFSPSCRVCSRSTRGGQCQPCSGYSGCRRPR